MHTHGAFTALAVALGLAAGAGPSEADAQASRPYGPAPDSITWRTPPTYLSTALPADGGTLRLPRRVTEVDVWTTNADGQATYRLRDRGRCFTRARSRACLVARNGRTLTSDYAAARHGLVVYGWAS